MDWNQREKKKKNERTTVKLKQFKTSGRFTTSVTITLVEYGSKRYQKMRVKKHEATVQPSCNNCWLDAWRIEMVFHFGTTVTRIVWYIGTTWRNCRPCILTRKNLCSPSIPNWLPLEGQLSRRNSRDLFRDKYSGRSARLKSGGPPQSERLWM